MDLKNLDFHSQIDLLNVYYVPDMVFGIEQILANKTGVVPGQENANNGHSDSFTCPFRIYKLDWITLQKSLRRPFIFFPPSCWVCLLLFACKDVKPEHKSAELVLKQMYRTRQG